MLPDFDSHLARLSNYERVLTDVIRTSKQELLDMSVICTFLRIIRNRDFSKISYDEFLRIELHIDSRRFLNILKGRTLLNNEERKELHYFNRANQIE